MKKNYQAVLDELILQIDPAKTGEKPKKLLLHSCCAPCSSYVIEYLSAFFEITVFYYNPNITEQEEYQIRAKEQQKLISQMKTLYPVSYLEGEHDVSSFFHLAKGLEKEPEGGERCERCYELRLDATAGKAKELAVDYFSTTLTISPMKRADKLNEIGYLMEEKYGVSFLPSDFKKKNGYQRSVELSKEYELYRQDYCGCVFSKAEAIKREKERQMKQES